MIRDDEYLENSAITGWMDRGALRAERSMLLRLMERRFGLVPEWASKQVASADGTTLLRWLDRVHDAPGIDAVFSENA